MNLLIFEITTIKFICGPVIDSLANKRDAKRLSKNFLFWKSIFPLCIVQCIITWNQLQYWKEILSFLMLDLKYEQNWFSIQFLMCFHTKCVFGWHSNQGILLQRLWPYHKCLRLEILRLIDHLKFHSLLRIHT